MNRNGPHAESFRVTSFFLAVWMMVMASHASAGIVAVPRGVSAAITANEGCKDCSDNGGEGGAPSGVLCSLKYIVYFLWYAVMAVVFVVVIVMDLATAFTQDYTKDFARWFIDADRSLDRFFRSLGCG